MDGSRCNRCFSRFVCDLSLIHIFMPLTLESSDVLLNRIDAVVLEINNDSDVRKNTIKILKGTPASNPVKPSLIKSEMVNQYPLAYITIGKGVLSISPVSYTHLGLSVR